MTTSDLHMALENWARWARSPVVELGVPEPPAFAHWLPRNDWDAGWGDVEAAPTVIHPPVDEAAALHTDRLLMRLPMRHWRVIRRAYYLQRAADRQRLDAAFRALQDLVDNRLTMEAAWA